MGLDNGFVGHFKRHPEVKMELAYFRKYFNFGVIFEMPHKSVVKSHGYSSTTKVRIML